MKQSMVLVVALALATPAYAQLGGLGGVLKKAQQAQDAKKKIDDLTFSDEEERTIGADVSAKIRERFGVAQDQAVHKYVALVGMAVAQQSERPKLDWTFIVLDTDGVNAFASPGGFVHVTRGALGLMKNEAELAAVLGHEIGHITRKHTINALKKSAATGSRPTSRRNGTRSSPALRARPTATSSRMPGTGATSSTPTRCRCSSRRRSGMRRPRWQIF